MDLGKVSSYGSRIFFAAALILFIMAVLEWLLFRMQERFWLGYEPGRLVEFAAMFLLPVITVLLRQIREELRKKQA